MHKIILDLSIVSMLTNSIDSTTHKHWMLQLFFNPKGNMDLTVEGTSVIGQCILVNTNTNHTFRTSDDLHFSMLITPGTDICEYLINTYIHESPYYDFSSLVDENLISKFEQFIHAPEQEKYLEFRNELFKSWRVPLNQSVTDKDERVRQIIYKLTSSISDTVSNDFYIEPLSIDELAKSIAISPSRLAHLFKEETGVPLKSYLVLMNVFTAFKMLLSSTSVTEAAMSAGFDSPSHLAATIKGMMGTSATFAIKDSEFSIVPIQDK